MLMKALKSLSFLILLSMSFQLSEAQEREYRPVRTPQPQAPQEQAPVEQKAESKTEKEKTGKWDWENFRVGGSFGLGFGPQIFLDISPSFGYFIQPGKWQVGIGTRFMYWNQRDTLAFFDPLSGRTFLSAPFKTAFYGGSVFSNYNVWNGLVVHGEVEMINRQYYNVGIEDYERIWVPHLLVGAGYMQPIGSAGNFFILALFNVLDRDESIYAGSFGNLPLIIRTGFGFGFPGGR
jgi:hypothetical protein